MGNTRQLGFIQCIRFVFPQPVKNFNYKYNMHLIILERLLACEEIMQPSHHYF